MSDANQPPKGQYFSRTYLDRGDGLSDSERFRTRLYGYFWYYVGPSLPIADAIAATIRMELGVQVPYYGQYTWQEFFQKSDVRDVLDTITITYDALKATAGGQSAAGNWCTEVGRTFREEGLLYSIDSQAGVHRAIDAEFEHNRATVIRSLNGERYRAVAAALESAFKKVEQTHQDAKGAIRDVFEAVETIAKLLTESNSNLSSDFITKHLKPIINKVYGSDAAVASTTARMATSFDGWVNAAHPFRHGHKTEVPIDLPEEVAVLLLSQGASFVRWLADTDRRVHS